MSVMTDLSLSKESPRVLSTTQQQETDTHALYTRIAPPTGDRHLFILGAVDAILGLNIRRFEFIQAGFGALILTILRNN